VLLPALIALMGVMLLIIVMCVGVAASQNIEYVLQRLFELCKFTGKLVGNHDWVRGNHVNGKFCGNLV
jgi:hypothetical protein